MENITLGSPRPLRAHGAPPGHLRVKPKIGQMEKVTNKSYQVCFSDDKNPCCFLTTAARATVGRPAAIVKKQHY